MPGNFAFLLLLLALGLTALASALKCPLDNNAYVQGVYPISRQKFLPQGTQLSAGFNFTTAATAGTQDYYFYNLTIQIGITCIHGDQGASTEKLLTLSKRYYQALHIVDLHYPRIKAGRTVPGPHSTDQGSLVTIGTLCPGNFILSQGPPALFASVASDHHTRPKISLHLTIRLPNGQISAAQGPFKPVVIPTYPLVCVPTMCPNISNLVLVGQYPTERRFDLESTIGAGFIFTTPSDAGIRNYTFYNLTVTYTLINVKPSYASGHTGTTSEGNCHGGYTDISSNVCTTVTFAIPDQHYYNVPGGATIPIVVTDQSGIVGLPPSPTGDYFFGNVPPVLSGFVASTDDAVVLQVASVFSLHTGGNATGRMLIARTISDFAPMLQGTYPILCAPAPQPCAVSPNINIIGNYPNSGFFTTPLIISYNFTTPIDVGTQNYTFYNLTLRYRGGCENNPIGPIYNFNRMATFANYLYVNVAAGATVKGQTRVAPVPFSNIRRNGCSLLGAPKLTGYLSSSDANTIVLITLQLQILAEETQTSGTNLPGSYPQQCNVAAVPCTNTPNILIEVANPEDEPQGGQIFAQYNFTTAANAGTQNYTIYAATVSYYGTCAGASTSSPIPFSSTLSFLTIEYDNVPASTTIVGATSTSDTLPSIFDTHDPLNCLFTQPLGVQASVASSITGSTIALTVLVSADGATSTSMTTMNSPGSYATICATV